MSPRMIVVRECCEEVALTVSLILSGHPTAIGRDQEPGRIRTGFVLPEPWSNDAPVIPTVGMIDTLSSSWPGLSPSLAYGAAENKMLKYSFEGIAATRNGIIAAVARQSRQASAPTRLRS